MISGAPQPFLPPALLMPCIGLALALVLLWPGLALAQNGANSGNTGLPRMASVRADEANVRTGPGVRYPVSWVFRRQDMPVLILDEYDTWRKIRDWEGAEGWMHRAMLSRRRTILVTAEEITLRRTPEADAPVVARLATGVTARITNCDPNWCRLEVGDYDGWSGREGFWGLGRGETVK